MLTALRALVDGFAAALSGMAEPAAIAMALLVTTLLVEDLAIAAGIALAVQGLIDWPLSLLAVGGGIALGDVGLYGLGVAATRVPLLRDRFIGEATRRVQGRLVSHLGSAVMIARVIPGARLVTYTTCGFLRVPVLPFVVWAIVSVSLWTCTLYALSAAIGTSIADNLGVPPALAAALPVLVLAAAVPLVRHFKHRHRHARP